MISSLAPYTSPALVSRYVRVDFAWASMAARVAPRAPCHAPPGKDPSVRVGTVGWHGVCRPERAVRLDHSPGWAYRRLLERPLRGTLLLLLWRLGRRFGFFRWVSHDLCSPSREKDAPRHCAFSAAKARKPGEKARADNCRERILCNYAFPNWQEAPDLSHVEKIRGEIQYKLWPKVTRGESRFSS